MSERDENAGHLLSIAGAPAGDAATGESVVAESIAAEPKHDPLGLLAVDANELARAIWSGQGTDVSRLVSDLLRGRDAA